MHRPLVFLILAIFFLAMPRAIVPAGAATIYVACDGNDANPGSADRPFRTLDRAHEEVCKLRGDPQTHQGVTVVMRGGTYTRLAPLVLDARDSGTAEFSVVWQAAEGEQVRITGGPVLPADEFGPVTDAHVLARLSADAQRHVQVCDLKSLRLKLANYPTKFAGAALAPELFFNDQPMSVARWPNGQWATIAKFVDSGQRPGDG